MWCIVHQHLHEFSSAGFVRHTARTQEDSRRWPKVHVRKYGTVLGRCILSRCEVAGRRLDKATAFYRDNGRMSECIEVTRRKCTYRRQECKHTACVSNCLWRRRTQSLHKICATWMGRKLKLCSVDSRYIRDGPVHASGSGVRIHKMRRIQFAITSRHERIGGCINQAVRVCVDSKLVKQVRPSLVTKLWVITRCTTQQVRQRNVAAQTKSEKELGLIR